jgi:hypothetical protein
MSTVHEIRRSVIGIGLALVGCVAMPDAVAPVASREPPSQPALAPLASGCPYANVYVDVSAQGAEPEAKLAERVRLAYEQSLGERGFSVVAAPDEAYWSAFSLVHLEQPLDAKFSWSVYMMATQDLRGRVQTPVRFAAAGDEQADLSGFMLLKQVRVMELDRQVRRGAEDTAGALLPHASRMCVAWTSEPQDDAAPGFTHVRGTDDLVEKLRDELAQDIQRIRRSRQQRDLEIGVEPSP